MSGLLHFFYSKVHRVGENHFHFTVMSISQHWMSNTIQVIDSDKTDADAKHVPSTSAAVPTTTVVQEHGTLDDEQVVRLHVQFQVTVSGAAKAGSRRVEDQYMPNFIRLGCEEPLYAGCVWNLNHRLLASGFVNVAMINGWLIAAQVGPDSNCNLELLFKFVPQRQTRPEIQLGRIGGGSAWSLARFWRACKDMDMSDDSICHSFNDAWKNNNLILYGTRQLPRFTRPVAVAPPSCTKVTATVAPIIAAQATTENPQVKRIETAKYGTKCLVETPQGMRDVSCDTAAMDVPPLEKEQDTTPVVPSTSAQHNKEKTAGIKMQFIVDGRGLFADRDGDMIKFLRDGCEGKSNVWIMDRAFQHVSNPTASCGLYRQAIANGYLCLVREPPRLRLGKNGLALCRDTPLMWGPMHYFLSMGSDDGDAERGYAWLGLDHMRSQIPNYTRTGPEGATMCRIAIANYESYLAIACSRQWIESI